jgi:hypothetical protein
VTTRSSASSELLRVVKRERLVVAFPAVFGGFVLLELPKLLSQDGWLALVAGRSIAHHGLPNADTLAVYTHGTHWIDQQWLSHLAFFGLHEAGGMRLLLLVLGGLIIAALALALVAARQIGASPLAVALVSLVAIASFGEVALSVRPQVLGLVLFVVTLWLLVEDARRPSRRVFWVLPLLAVWANLHGSVLLGAGLVVLRSACAIADASRGRASARHGLLLAGGALIAIFVTPYALDMPHYYASTAFNPQFTALVKEWQRTAPSALTAPFYFLLFMTVGLLARHPRSITTYEKLVLLATGVLGLLALRNIAWFALAAIVILPLALDRSIPVARDDTARRAVLPIAYGPPLFVALVLAVTALRPATWFGPRYPSEAVAGTVARVTSNDPGARVFSDVQYADWLMWRNPSLEGRMAFDSRLELLTRDQLSDIFRFGSQVSDRWRRAAAGYRVVVLDRQNEPGGDRATYRQLLKEPGARLVYLSAETAVVLRGQPSA